MPSTFNNLLSYRIDQGRRHDQARQYGSVAVMAAIFLSVIVILLSSVDIGYMFYMKRNLQKIADLAALAGTQQLVSTPPAGSPASCASTDKAVLAAIGNAQMNGFSTAAPNPMSNSLTVTCGRWDPTANAALAPNYFSAPPASTSLNAVRVVMAQNVPAFFGFGTHTLNAQAIASSSDPIAAFSVGSKLLQINNGVVPGLLSTLGLNLTGTSLVSYNGLANVSVTPNGLLQALGFQIPLHANIGTVTTILSANTTGCSNGMCTLQAILGAMASVGGQQNLVSALGLTAPQLGLQVPLLSDSSGQGGLFTLANAADAQSALNLNLNALTVLNTAIAVANSKRFVTAPVNITLPGLSVATWIGLVEPPSIGIGGVGTTAYTAQVRLYVHITGGLPILNLLTIDLPLIIDVVNGLGTLTNMCTAKDSNGHDLATIAVQAPILSLCAGGINSASTAGDAATLNTVFSTKNVCQANLTNYQMINVLNGTLKVNTKIAVDALTNNSSVTLSKGQTVTTPGNNLQIGSTVSALVAALASSLLNSLLGGSSVNNNNLATGLLNGQSLAAAQTLVSNSLGYLNTLVSSLSSSVTSLLSLNPLGILTSVGGLVSNLLNSILQFLGNLLCLGNSQCIMSGQLAGSQTSGSTSVSNAAIAVVGLLVNLLQPILNGLGSALSTLLSNLLGIQLGLVDVTLLDLNCGGTSVSLVY